MSRKVRDTFAFALGTAPYRDYQPFNGGCLRLLASVDVTGGVTTTIQHNLRRVPNTMLIFAASGTYGTPQWIAAASPAWNCSNIYVVFKSTYAFGPATLTVLIL